MKAPGNDARAGKVGLRWTAGMLATAGLISLASGASAIAGTTFHGTANGFHYSSALTGDMAAPGSISRIVNCESGRAISGGVIPTGATNEAYVTNSFDRTSPSGWWGAFSNVSGGSKHATVHVICTKRERFLHRSVGRTRIDPGKSRRATVRCPEGARVVAGPAFAAPPVEPPLWPRLVSSHPVDAKRDRAPLTTAGPCAITTRPTAGHFSSPLPPVSRPTAGSATGRGPGGSVFCPAGSHAIGGGIKHRKSDAAYAWVNATNPFDFNDADAIADDGWTGLGRDDTRPKKVYAICFK